MFGVWTPTIMLTRRTIIKSNSVVAGGPGQRGQFLLLNFELSKNFHFVGVQNAKFEAEKTFWGNLGEKLKF